MKTILYSLLAAASDSAPCQSPPPFLGAVACWTMADGYRPILAKAGDDRQIAYSVALRASYSFTPEKEITLRKAEIRSLKSAWIK